LIVAASAVDGVVNPLSKELSAQGNRCFSPFCPVLPGIFLPGGNFLVNRCGQPGKRHDFHARLQAQALIIL